MKSFYYWRAKNEAYIQRSELKRIGNELPRNQAEAGGISKSVKPFKSQLDGFKSKLSHKEPQPDGLGDKGMDSVGKSTFNSEPVKAGETPTISHGVPVGEIKGQFESFKSYKEFQNQPMQPTVAMGQQDPTQNPIGQQDSMPQDPLAELPSNLQTYINKAFDFAQRLGPQKYKEFVMALNRKTQMGMSDSKMSTGMGRTVGTIQSRNWRNGLN